MPPGRRARVLLVVGILLAITGAAVLAFVSTMTVGWFAYAPLPGVLATPGVTLGPAHLWGAAVGATGLAAAAWAWGYLAGRRAEGRSSAGER